MKDGVLTLRQAAESVQVDAAELRHAAQRGELEAVERAGEWLFGAASLQDWTQRRLIASDSRRLAAHHLALDGRRRRACGGGETGIAPLFNVDAIDLSLSAKTKAGALRDMTDLAAASGMVYDPDALFRGLEEREEAASTAIGEGAAFLHMKELQPYIFEDFFIAYGRSLRPVYFGAPDGAPTRHFFLICSTGRERHLHTLARLAMLAHGTGLLERLDAAEDAAGAIEAVRDCENEWSADAALHGGGRAGG